MYCSYCGNFTDTDFCSHCQEYIADEEFDYHNDDIETDINDDDYRDDDDDNSEWKENYTHE